MSYEMTLLMGTAAFIAFFHTLLGPDHYLPFIVMGKARKWSMAKTAWITVLCGVGHVASSVLLGFIGIALGVALTSLVAVESFRGNLAAWALIAFGLVYFVWGMRRAWRLPGSIWTREAFREKASIPIVAITGYAEGECQDEFKADIISPGGRDKNKSRIQAVLNLFRSPLSPPRPPNGEDPS